MLLSSLFSILRQFWNFSCCGCGAWSLASIFLEGGTHIFPGLGQPVYIGVAAACVFSLSSLHWAKIENGFSWINSQRAPHKFAALYDKIKFVLKLVKRPYFYMDRGHIPYSEPLRHKLENLKIFLPKNEREWTEILPMLLAYAEDGRIKDARKFTAKWKQ